MEENLKQQATSIIKIALFGPESTGKTTLAKQLASHFETVWAPEFARNYLQQKWDAKQKACEPEDLLPIAAGQVKTENDALLTANKYLFCDTTLMATKVFSEMYYNFCDPALDKAARKHKYDLFFLTDVDVPWQKDDLRDQSDDRSATFEAFRNALVENEKPYIILSGNKKQRMEAAESILRDFEKAREMGFSSQDFIKIYSQGISPHTIEDHIAVFTKGIAKTILDRPATKEDGILRLADEDYKKYADYFGKMRSKYKLKKFVPASGAASRMFKFLNEFLNEFNIEEESINAYINRKNATALSVFLVGLEKLPFYEEIDLSLQKSYSNFKSFNKDLRDYYFIKALLSSNHFDFAAKPKGILPFHKYTTHIATPVQEHLTESCLYACDGKVSNLHFTVSPEHQTAFEKIINEVKGEIEGEHGNKININFSYQNKATDTLAVDTENNPFRDDKGQLVFRPGGHGALIENLNSLDADIVFIKNIDNVIQNHIEEIALYKKALAGVMIELQQEIYGYLKRMESGSIGKNDIPEIRAFAKDRLNISLIEDFEKYTLENKLEYLEEILNRPIRVCGMVKNEGEPGGGPFWVLDKKGNISLQIVESTQVDLQNSSQLEILKNATHFNPVDLVCGLKNYKGKKFDLLQFIDKSSGFIVDKNKNGRPLKAYELPGLWNGAMAKWITVFVQVPLVTFNPVKTVNDLLKPPHQPQ
jgi:nicotinamide riboside kinase